jgi:hypothetical protein
MATVGGYKFYLYRCRRTRVAAIATAQTGAIVMTNGRMVSLAEFELRSKASNTATVPNSRRSKATASAAISLQFIAQGMVVGAPVFS